MKSEAMKRGQFLRELGLSSGALMAFYCLGTTLTACSSGSDTPTPANNNNSSTGNNTSTGITGSTSGTIDFNIDLTHTDFTKLKTEGGFAVVAGIIVAFTKDKAYVAVSKDCTHQGNQLVYRLAENDFWCSNHGSEFSTTGAVEKDPATKSLTVYKTTLSTNGNSLNVKA